MPELWRAVAKEGAAETGTTLLSRPDDTTKKEKEINVIKLVISIVVAFGLVLAVVTWPKNGECIYCPTYKCFGSCGFKCSCVTLGGEVGGMCVSIERASEFMDRGWTVLP